MLSVIIPSRSAQWLKQTVADLFAKAEGEIEVIVVYDGRWPDPQEFPADDPRLIQIHHGEHHDNLGMRESINVGVLASKGDYIMKIDEQCMVDQGFDLKLARDCEETMVVIPRRKRLDPETWSLVEDGRNPIDYMYIEYPYAKPFDKTQGLHGAEWKQRFYDRQDVMIDDTPTSQGSCYFLKRSYWDKLLPSGLDSTKYGTFTMEAQELSMAAWLSGGRVVVNKNTWYAHWHKGTKGKGYGFTNAQYRRHMEGTERGRLYAIKYWLYTDDYKYNWEWFMQKFPDMPGWGDDWKGRLALDKHKDYSTLGYKDDKWLINLRTL